MKHPPFISVGKGMDFLNKKLSIFTKGFMETDRDSPYFTYFWVQAGQPGGQSKQSSTYEIFSHSFNFPFHPV